MESPAVEIPTDDPSSALLFTTDNQHLLSAEGSSIKMRTLDGATVQQFTGHTKLVSVMKLHPDGERLVSGAHDQTVRIWDCDGT